MGKVTQVGLRAKEVKQLEGKSPTPEPCAGGNCVFKGRTACWKSGRQPRRKGQKKDAEKEWSWT